MRDLIRQGRIGGLGVPVGDCYVWSEIYYLDSPTDYREFLPPNNQRPVPVHAELVMLDDGVAFLRIMLNWFLVVARGLCRLPWSLQHCRQGVGAKTLD